MKIDSAIKTFFEKYNRDAIQSIDEISKDYSLNISNSMIKAFNMSESFNIFNQYLNGYASYKIENVNNDQALSQTEIKESVKKFIDTQIFKECEIKYPELPRFVAGYVSGINSITETVDNIKRDMTDANVDANDIGDINEFADMFMNKLNESFDPTMDNILWASGYNAKQRLANSNTNKTKVPVFL